MVTDVSQNLDIARYETSCWNQHQTLGAALQSMEGDSPADIPHLIRLLENPESPFALPGKIDLYRHDCLHLLLDRGFSLYDEAFVVGFTMGNDVRTNRFHLAIFKLASHLFYPKSYRFNRSHLVAFDLGVLYGRRVKVKNINQVDFHALEDQSLDSLRSHFDINWQEIKVFQKIEWMLSI